VTHRIVFIAIVSLSIACSRESRLTPTEPSATPTLSLQASNHLDEVIRLMQANSFHRLAIDWNAFRSEVMSAAAAAQTVEQTLPAIRLAIARLGDGHSSYRSASGASVFVAVRSCTGSGGPSRPQLPPTIGYVSVGAFGGTPAEAAVFANNIQAAIRNADQDGMQGWIVDLRGNGGGNMWPMVAGLGPVLGEGLVGHFISATGAVSAWEYRDGASWSGTFAAHRVEMPYRLRRERPRVAILTDTAVASSGEATAIAFRQRPDTRSFGLPTCGLSTANQPYTLSDGAVLNLTTAVMADRTRARYGDVVVPDEVIADRAQLAARAVSWIQTGQ
jgi:carboxyl-terminal processing protease